VAERHRDASASLVRSAMETAYPLDVPLRVDVGWGTNWAEAAPAGH
jgi:DNA polymerase I-like protein with 3'-5' exonuclease and polymerase domains